MSKEDVPHEIFDEPSEPVRISVGSSPGIARLPIAPTSPDFQLDESVYQLILDRVEDGVYFVDRNKHIRLWNSGAEDCWRFQKDSYLALSKWLPEANLLESYIESNVELHGGWADCVGIFQVQKGR